MRGELYVARLWPIIDYTAALSLNRDDYSSYWGRGLAHKKLGQLEEARAHYSAALRLRPNTAELYDNRGNVLTQLVVLQAD